MKVVGTGKKTWCVVMYKKIKYRRTEAILNGVEKQKTVWAYDKDGRPVNQLIYDALEKIYVEKNL